MERIDELKGAVVYPCVRFPGCRSGKKYYVSPNDKEYSKEFEHIKVDDSLLSFGCSYGRDAVIMCFAMGGVII